MYSDKKVKTALHSFSVLILKEEGIFEKFSREKNVVEA